MTGEELYTRYFALQDELNNCIEATWAQLSTGEQVVWEALALQVVEQITNDVNDSWEGHRE